MNHSKTIRACIYLILVATVIFLIWSNWKTPEEKMLIDFSREINPQLPKMVDRVTRFDKVIPVVGNILNYQFTILGIKAAEINRASLKSSMTSYFWEDYKNDPAIQKLRDIGTTFVYTYFDEDGILVCEIRIGPNEQNPQ